MARLSLEEEQLIAQGWVAGLPSRRIAREIGRSHRTVHDEVERLREGPRRLRHRSPRQLSLAERGEISRGLAVGRSVRVIAAGLGRSASTVCREINRNGGPRGYRATRADERA
jgi:IS30 family transposase